MKKLEPGTRVQDYTLVEKLGSGAFGEVWKAAHRHLPRLAAIKFGTSEAAAAALERNGVAQFGLEHPGIVRVLDADLAASPPFVVMEHVDGRSLRQLLRERGRLEIQEVSAIFRQLAEALDFAHRRGVIHGDVKPENVLVIGAPEERSRSGAIEGPGVRKIVKLTDFQLGSTTAGERPEVGQGGVRPSLPSCGPRSGTYRYLAPEQEMGQPIDGRADIFALGVVLFEMATGTLPQGRDLPSDVNPALSWWWDHIFSRAYTGRERRYRDTAEVLADLAAAELGPRWGEMPSQRRPAEATSCGAWAPDAGANARTRTGTGTGTGTGTETATGAETGAGANDRPWVEPEPGPARPRVLVALAAGLALALAVPMIALQALTAPLAADPGSRLRAPCPAFAESAREATEAEPCADEAEALSLLAAECEHHALAAKEAATWRDREDAEAEITRLRLRARALGYDLKVVRGRVEAVRIARRY